MIRNISVSDLMKLGSNINLIDIRGIQKYNDNHIMNAINIPKEVIISEYSKYLDKSKIYYIYCQSGHKSIKICRLLNNLGYNVYNVIGGYESFILSK